MKGLFQCQTAKASQLLVNAAPKAFAGGSTQGSEYFVPNHQLHE
jgi:hypothetical protein